MDISLRPCPFCGGEAVLFVDDGVRVICLECRAQTSTLADRLYDNSIGKGSIKTVVNAWNRRADDAQD